MRALLDRLPWRKRRREIEEGFRQAMLKLADGKDYP